MRGHDRGDCHPRESGGPAALPRRLDMGDRRGGLRRRFWMPAFAGMTGPDCHLRESGGAAPLRRTLTRQPSGRTPAAVLDARVRGHDRGDPFDGSAGARTTGPRRALRATQPRPCACLSAFASRAGGPKQIDNQINKSARNCSFGQSANRRAAWLNDRGGGSTAFAKREPQ